MTGDARHTVSPVAVDASGGGGGGCGSSGGGGGVGDAFDRDGRLPSHPHSYTILLMSLISLRDSRATPHMLQALMKS